MAKIKMQDYRRTRTHELMDIFIKDSGMAKSLTCAGYKFEQVHEAQIPAAKVVHEMYQEGLLDLAQEFYPEETENLKDYLAIYNEIASGKEQ